MGALSELLDDVDAEYGDLRSIVGRLGAADPAWDAVTPAEGWMVRDQISHLAYFDDAGRTAIEDPAAFTALAEELMGSTGDPMAVHLDRGRALDGAGLLAWWDDAHRRMMAAFVDVDPADRIPWFGPSMGARSFLTARLMETWAHGQDVVDALGADRAPTDRLRHVAHIGVAARPFSYVVRGRDVPPGQITVAVEGPSGDTWTWAVGEEVPGREEATVTGSALDFCLVVTQRRNVADTGLVVVGGLAEDWVSVAQAFAGPPGPGRPPAGA